MSSRLGTSRLARVRGRAVDLSADEPAVARPVHERDVLLHGCAARAPTGGGARVHDDRVSRGLHRADVHLTPVEGLGAVVVVALHPLTAAVGAALRRPKRPHGGRPELEAGVEDVVEELKQRVAAAAVVRVEQPAHELTRLAHAASRSRNRSKRWTASCGPGPASGWYWTVDAGTSRKTRPSTVRS